MKTSDRALLESLDIQQSVLLRLHRRLPELRFESEAQLVSWLREAASRVLQEKRRDARRAKRDVRRNVRYPTAGHPDVAASSVQKALLRIHVEEALGHLPEDARTVVRLKRIEGYSYAEVARAMGLRGPDAARKRCARALFKLERLLPRELTRG
jgi:RNA polymerase sigma-70 factor (ECF subfamily)